MCNQLHNLYTIGVCLLKQATRGTTAPDGISPVRAKEVTRIMEHHEIKFAVIARMWRDGIVMGRQYAEVESVVRRAAIPKDAVGEARQLLSEEMVRNDHSPVVKTGASMVALKRDKDTVRDALLRFADDESDLPWDLR